jgi:hypothetical protein
MTKTGEVSLDATLRRLVKTLDATSLALAEKAQTAGLTKDDISSLASLIKITLEIQGRETKSLQDMSTAQLEALVKGEEYDDRK